GCRHSLGARRAPYLCRLHDETGIGGVLNTSFNLHGEPMVCSPEDAVHTLDNSGLEFLAIENYLISRN
ncbi:hypothetical protein COT30_04355, partial [Candidatus Micrarchaeota archaeon CG08_land_8_20_14_0_20_49_17]